MTPSRQHLRRVKQNKVAPPRQGSKLYAATPRSTQSHAEDLRDLLYGMHHGIKQTYLVICIMFQSIWRHVRIPTYHICTKKTTGEVLITLYNSEYNRK